MQNILLDGLQKGDDYSVYEEHCTEQWVSGRKTVSQRQRPRGKAEAGKLYSSSRLPIVQPVSALCSHLSTRLLSDGWQCPAWYNRCDAWI